MATIPSRYYTLVFSLILSCMMSLLMSGVVTLLNTGVDSGFVARWLHAAGVAWAVAFPLASVITPLSHRLTRRLVAQPQN